MKSILNNFICYLWKHKITDNDNGCDICGRCSRHEYYDNDFHNGKPFIKIYFLFRHKLLLFQSWYRIKFFNRLPF